MKNSYLLLGILLLISLYMNIESFGNPFDTPFSFGNMSESVSTNQSVCKDDNTWTNNNKSCRDYSIVGSNCSDIGDNGVTAFDACRVACDNCPKSVEIKIREPSPSADYIEPPYSSLDESLGEFIGESDIGINYRDIFMKLSELEEQIRISTDGGSTADSGDDGEAADSSAADSNADGGGGGGGGGGGTNEPISTLPHDSTQLMCSEYTCPGGSQLIADSGTTEQGATPEATCCEAVSQPVSAPEAPDAAMCSAVSCPEGQQLINGAESTVGADEATCCEQISTSSSEATAAETAATAPQITCVRPTNQAGYDFSGVSHPLQGVPVSDFNSVFGNLACASGYDGNPQAIPCDENGQEFVLEGCSPITCTQPTDPAVIAGYDFTNIENTDLSAPTFNVNGLECASGYGGSSSPSAEPCGESGPYTVTGCDPIICTQPTEAGYDFSGVSEAGLNLSSGTLFRVTGLACASGYEGSEPSAGPCVQSGPYTVTGCDPITCRQPTDQDQEDIAGYDFSSVEETGITGDGSDGPFSVTGLECAENYNSVEGGPTAMACDTDEGPYVVAGCSFSTSNLNTRYEENLLSQVPIIGSHNSAAFRGNINPRDGRGTDPPLGNIPQDVELSPGFCYQTQTLVEQFNSGVRYFDIHLREISDKIYYTDEYYKPFNDIDWHRDDNTNYLKELFDEASATGREEITIIGLHLLRDGRWSGTLGGSPISKFFDKLKTMELWTTMEPYKHARIKIKNWDELKTHKISDILAHMTEQQAITHPKVILLDVTEKLNLESNSGILNNENVYRQDINNELEMSLPMTYFNNIIFAVIFIVIIFRFFFSLVIDGTIKPLKVFFLIFVLFLILRAFIDDLDTATGVRYFLTMIFFYYIICIIDVYFSPKRKNYDYILMVVLLVVAKSSAYYDKKKKLEKIGLNLDEDLSPEGSKNVLKITPGYLNNDNNKYKDDSEKWHEFRFSFNMSNIFSYKNTPVNQSFGVNYYIYEYLLNMKNRNKKTNMNILLLDNITTNSDKFDTHCIRDQLLKNKGIETSGWPDDKIRPLTAKSDKYCKDTGEWGGDALLVMVLLSILISMLLVMGGRRGGTVEAPVSTVREMRDWLNDMHATAEAASGSAAAAGRRAGHEVAGRVRAIGGRQRNADEVEFEVNPLADTDTGMEIERTNPRSWGRRRGRREQGEERGGRRRGGQGGADRAVAESEFTNPMAE